VLNYFVCSWTKIIIFGTYKPVSCINVAAALNLARDTKQRKWREIGEKAVQSITQWAQYSSWNFENKQLLLQAELHYLNGRHMMAELVYALSITSAREHKFLGEEAMSNELFGIYLVENDKVDCGIQQLEMSYKKYMQWGAFNKARAVEALIDGVQIIRCRIFSTKVL